MILYYLFLLVADALTFHFNRLFRLFLARVSLLLDLLLVLHRLDGLLCLPFDVQIFD